MPSACAGPSIPNKPCRYFLHIYNITYHSFHDLPTPFASRDWSCHCFFNFYNQSFIPRLQCWTGEDGDYQAMMMIESGQNNVVTGSIAFSLMEYLLDASDVPNSKLMFVSQLNRLKPKFWLWIPTNSYIYLLLILIRLVSYQDLSLVRGSCIKVRHMVGQCYHHKSLDIKM